MKNVEENVTSLISPAFEGARLAALYRYDILDTAQEQEFDDFTDLAAQICAAPVAMISLVDGTRLWSKSPDDMAACEINCDEAFCAHTVAQRGLFIIPDTAADPRFADSPAMIGGTRARSYAGVPLITRDGHTIGAFCVIDTVPRGFSPQQERALVTLARQVMARLELCRILKEQTDTARALRESQSLNDAMLEAALDCVITIDDCGRIVEWNAAAEKTFCYTRAQAVGRSLVEMIVPPSLRAAHTGGVAHFLTSGEGPILKKRIEVTACRADGSEFPVELTVIPIRLGRRFLFTATLRDVTEHKATEYALRQARDEMERRVEERTAELARLSERHRALLDSAGEGIYGIDADGRTTFVNFAAAEMLGWSAADLIGQPMHAMLHHTYPSGAPYPAVECPIYAGLRSGAVCREASEVFWRKDGTSFYVEYTSTPIREAGHVTGAVITFRDITAQRRAAEEVHASREMLQCVMDNIPQRIFWKDRNSVYQGGNTGFAHAAGLNAANEIAGKTDYDLPWKLSETEWFRKVDGRVMSTDAPEYRIIEEQRQADGSEAWLETNKIPLHDAEGRVSGILGTYEDITERVLREQQIVALNHELAQAYDATIEGWSRALDMRDRETEGHSRRVTDMTLILCAAVGFSDKELLQVRRGALLHDIGKMGVPDAVLLKPGPLSDAEWSVMHRHPANAYALLSPIEFLRPALDIPYCHHEKWDGSGYPRGLRGQEIPLAARLFAVVDVWDALRSDRPYRTAWPAAQVRAHIASLAGTHFDPSAVDVLLAATAAEADNRGKILSAAA